MTMDGTEEKPNIQLTHLERNRHLTMISSRVGKLRSILALLKNDQPKYPEEYEKHRKFAKQMCNEIIYLLVSL